MNTRFRKVPILGSLLALVCAGALTATAFADGQVFGGNTNCGEIIPGSLELRINAPGDGTFSNPDGFSVVVDVRTLAADAPDHPGDQTGSQVFDFTASGGSVVGVAVKGGTDVNFYDYRPAGTNSGTGLHSPVNTKNQKFYGLSHISFCYVPKAKPAIVTHADAEVTVGETFNDVATLSGGNNPTGSITFRLYAPGDTSCADAAIFTDSVAVAGNGDYASASYTSTATGTYRWIASYSGDANNEPASGACNDSDENTVVKKQTPAITTQVSSAEVVIGTSFHDTATLSGGFEPTGSITFEVYGPDDADCTGAVVFTDTVSVDGNGDYDSAAFTPSHVGKYRWIASYSGDGNNEAAAGACNDANEDTTVTRAPADMDLTNWVSPQAQSAVTLLQQDPDTGLFGDGDESASDPTDDVVIKLYAGADCQGDAEFSEGFQIDGDQPMPQTFTTTNTTFYVQLDGSVAWSWKAFYEGDAVNSDLETECQNVTAEFSTS